MSDILSDYRQDPFTGALSPVAISGECHTVPNTGKPYIKLKEKPLPGSILTVQTTATSKQTIATKDSASFGSFPSTNNGGNVNLAVGQGMPGLAAGEWITSMEFDLASCPASAVLARVCMFKFPQTVGGTAPVPISVHRIAPPNVVPWTEFGVTYNNFASGPATPSSDVVSVTNNPGGTASGPWYHWNITSVFNGWQSAAFPNYGVLFVPQTTTQDTVRNFHSRQSPFTTQRPYLEVSVLGAALTPSISFPPGPGEYFVNFEKGCVALHDSLAGQIVCFSYQGMGSNLSASLLCEVFGNTT